MGNIIPKYFCWTRMGDEAGQKLQNTIKRKEFERQLGNGIFCWGVGNSILNSIDLLLKKEKNPKLYFSTIRSKSKLIDRSPEDVCLWTSYLHNDRVQFLPEHVFVTSRAYVKNHYIFFCCCEDNLLQIGSTELNYECLRHIKTGSNISFQSITSVVEYNPQKVFGNKIYPISFCTDLIQPYFVKLLDSVILEKKWIKEMDDLVEDENSTSKDWFDLVQKIRKSI